MAEENNNEQKNPNGSRIVWIEDDNFLGSLISKKLSSEGYEVAYVNTGEDAMAKIKEQKPALVLADIMLPGIDGFEVLKQIKEDDNLKDVPVILFSNLSQEEDINKGLELGAESFLVKSNVVPDQIVSKIKELLEAK